MAARSHLLALFLAAALWLAHAAAEERPIITEINFFGNDTTEERILLQEMTIHVGDPADPGAIAQSQQAIMDLRLFKTVRAELKDAPGGKALNIHVSERYYILPLPRLDAKPNGDYSYGLELRFDNLFGLNQRLKTVYRHKDSTNGHASVAREAAVEYSYPRIMGSAYLLDSEAALETQDVTVEDELSEATEDYRRDTYKARIGLSRWLSQQGPSRGWLAGFGLAFHREEYDVRLGQPALVEDSQSFAVTGNIGFEDVHEFPFHRAGVAYGYTGELAVPSLGSDHSYNRHRFYHRRYLPLDANRSNLNTRLQLGLANGTSFGEPAHTIGSAATLRGYASGLDKGNALLLANVEYHHQLSGYRQLRGVVFTDIGNVYAGVSELNLTDLRASIGVGLRWRVQSFVDITLTVDYAYGIDTQSQMGYVNTSGSF